MFNYGRVVTPAAFQTWARSFQIKEQRDGVLAALPPYALTYDPTVIPSSAGTSSRWRVSPGPTGYYYPGRGDAGAAVTVPPPASDRHDVDEEMTDGRRDTARDSAAGRPRSRGAGAGSPWWMRPAMHTGVIGAVIGYFLGHLLGNFLSSGYGQNVLSDSNDVPIVLGYALATIGWLAGLGVFNDLIRTMSGQTAA